MKTIQVALAIAVLAVSGCAQMEMGKYGVQTGDHEMTVARCGVGNYLFHYAPNNTCAAGSKTEAAAVAATPAKTATAAHTQAQAAPATEKKAKLVEDATTHKSVIEIAETVNFEMGSARLTKSSEKLLDDVAALVKENEMKVGALHVEGHTDALGAADKNLKLSEARAKSVKMYLAKKGLDASKISAKGFGQTRPKFTEKADMAKNRRVEFIVDPK